MSCVLFWEDTKQTKLSFFFFLMEFIYLGILSWREKKSDE